MASPTHEAGDVVAHGGAAFPPFEPSTFPSQLLWLAIAFGLLYYVMNRVIVPRFHGVVETREVTVARDLDAAATAKRNAEAAGTAYETALADAKSSAQAIASKTRDAMQAEADAKRRALEDDLAERLAAAEAQISARKTEAMANVRGIAEETAIAIVERISGRAPAPESVSAALDRQAAH
ncbi:F0F1 ATP synthase subunit B family protein [Salinarimonas ramus]|uniref:ATP synthase subunit b n=1 Tax=Salinarimonas ramus TaxID=690164 RepID=A0A917V565_9HYPH|nr:F0F1 ATP synthase subunit B' [Salinarimonas ramus]GGK39292.1 ATP synthase subunit b [Salinarimonas ramus]